MRIDDLRLLPPLTIARVGSAETPLDNFRLIPDPERPLELPRLCRDRTLLTDRDSGKIIGELPPNEESIAFKVGSKIRPVAPFIELYARVGDESDLRPLTEADLKTAGLRLRWRAVVGNNKMFRRTNDPNDKIRAEAGAEGGEHRVQALLGECANFLQGEQYRLPFGALQLIEPTADHPALRLRFWPGTGAVYGSTPLTEEQRRELKIPPVWHTARYEVPQERVFYDSQKGSWHGYRDDDETLNTLSQGLYAAYGKAPFFNFTDDPQPSRGMFDDICDGHVEVELLDKNDCVVQKARGRICSAPPIFAPDAQFVRRLADDLVQALEGPQHPEDARIPLAEAESIVRGAFQTVQFMNIAVLNGDTTRGRPNRADTMPADDSSDYPRPLAPVMAPHAVDTYAILALHQQLLATMKSGTPAWFSRLMRSPDATGDLSDQGRRKMPALMSGADTNYLALTRRQLDTLQRAGEWTLFDDERSPKAAALSPRNRTAQLLYQGEFNSPVSVASSSVGNCCPGLELDFRSAWRRVLCGITLVEHNNYVVQADPGLEQLLHHRLLEVDGHPTVAMAHGPSADGTGDQPYSPFTMEWSNTFAQILQKAGQKVPCKFSAEAAPHELKPSHQKTITVELEVRNFFEPESGLISDAIAEPGELTRGLCSPWQNDFRECVCYYWASSRPDYINLEPSENGSRGDNWMSKVRDGEYVIDDYQDQRLIDYADLFARWEEVLQFQIGGRDAP